MAGKLVLFVLCVGVAHAGFLDKALKHLKHEVEHIGNDLGKAVQNGIPFKVHYLDNIIIEDFSWSHCGGSDDILKIKYFTVEPNPVHLPGTVQVAFDMDVSQEISRPVDLDLHIKVKQKFFGWIDLPCIEHMGSCHYDDICRKPRHKCPAVLTEHGIPCHCPIPVGAYNLTKTTVPVKHVKLPSLVKSGEFKVKASLSSGGKPVTCVEVAFKLG